MKSNEKYVFSLIYTTAIGALVFYLNMPGDLDHMMILMSSTQLIV